MINFRIADTFTASLARLTGEEQKVVKTTAFDLQLTLPIPACVFHKLAKAEGQKLHIELGRSFAVDVAVFDEVLHL